MVVGWLVGPDLGRVTTARAHHDLRGWKKCAPHVARTPPPVGRGTSPSATDEVGHEEEQARDAEEEGEEGERGGDRAVHEGEGHDCGSDSVRLDVPPGGHRMPTSWRTRGWLSWTS